MSTDPEGFHFAASLRAGNLADATRALFDAGQSARDAVRLVDWRDAEQRAHDPARELPGDELGGLGLTFAGDAAFGVLERKDDGTYGVGVQHVVAGLGEDAQRAVLGGWAQICRALLRQGVLLAARVNRQVGGHCLPWVPLAEDATHLVVCSGRAIERDFALPGAFTAAWDSLEEHAGMWLCLRGLRALSNPAFLGHVLAGQMAMARAARPGRTHFYHPQFEAGELELLEAGEPSLTGVGYYPAEQVYEFAGHTPKGIELRCIDLLAVWKLATTGSVEGGGPVRAVRVVFMDAEQAGRSAKLLHEAGASVYFEDDRGQLQLLPADPRAG